MKRDKQDAAILALSILVAVLFIALIVINVFDLKLRQAETQPPEAGTASDGTQDGFQFSDTPEIILGSGDAQERDDALNVATDSGSVAMTLVTGSFAQRGGPDFSLYLDKETFQMTESGGHCYFSLRDSSGASLYLELAYHDGADAQTLAGALLSDYGIVADPQIQETAQLGDYEAANVQGRALETQLDAYVLQTAHGCITLVLCTPGNVTVAGADSLRASMETLVLTDN